MSSFLSPGTTFAQGRYILGEKLGAGSHGDVYEGKDSISEEAVAIKVESWGCEQLFLFHEYQVYQILQNARGFPKARWFNQDEGRRQNIMIMELLGPSLDRIHQGCNNKFSLKTVLLIADQILERVQYLHEKLHIHRSIKPENFSIGRDDSSLIYMIDFGNTKEYVNKSGNHIKCKVYSELGLAACHSRHQSIAALQRMERSRRDDLESVGYMLIYFLKGHLPWDEVMSDPVALKQVKMETPIDVLCEDCPDAFSEYMTYVRSLCFEETPDYDLLREMFRKLANRLGYQYDGKFDWIIMKQQQKEDASLSSMVATPETRTL